MLVQARTGKISLKKYHYDIGRSEDGDCPHCLRTPETVWHVLTVCPAWKDLRAVFYIAVEQGIDNIVAVLNDQKYAKSITNLMLCTRLLGQFLGVEAEQVEPPAPDA